MLRCGVGRYFLWLRNFTSLMFFEEKKSWACSQVDYIVVVYTLMMQRAFIFCLMDFSEANLRTQPKVVTTV